MLSPKAWRLIYITARDEAEAARIGRALVEERLVACVNIIAPIRSFYWWEGKVQDESEALLIAKTRRSLVPKVVRRVKALHSYTCPCVVALRISGGNRDFLRWIEGETR